MNLKTTLSILYILLSVSLFAQKNILKTEANKKSNQAISDYINQLKLKDSKKALDSITYTLGYLDYKVLKKDSVTTLNFGPIYKDLIIDLKNTNKTALNLLEEKRNTIRIEIQKTESLLNELKNKLISKGYPFTTLNLHHLKKDKNNLYASLNINLNDENERITSKINIKGYTKFPKSFLKHYLNIKENQPLQLNDLKKHSERINELAFAEEIKPPEILFTKDKTELFLYLKKVNSNNFDGIIGFNTNEETDKLEFNGYLNLNLVNNLNFGEQFTLNYKSDGNKQRNLQVKLNLPYLFKTKIGSELRLNIFNRDSTFTNTQIEIKSIYNLNTKTKLSLGYETFTSTVLEKSDVINLEDLESEYITLGTNFSNNKKKNQTTLTIATKLGTRTTGLKQTNQNKYALFFRKGFQINKRQSLELRNTTEIINSKNILQNELFRFGGINSLRGFNENTIEANLYSTLNLEYYYWLNNSISINSITDFGYFENDIIDVRKKLYSIGLGLNTATKAGLLKLNFANGILEGENFAFKNTKLHISLQAKF